MRYLLFLLVLFSKPAFSQDAKVKVLHEEKLNDSLIKQTIELRIHNDTQRPLCLKLSYSFLTILASDTVELAPIRHNSNCIFSELWVSKRDQEAGVNDLPRFPVVLNSRTCFVAYIKILKNVKCKDSWIEFSYTNQDNISYEEILKKYSNNEIWDKDHKIKFKIQRITLPD